MRYAKAANSQDADSQLWSETRLTYNIDKRFDLFTTGSFRLTQDFSDFTRASGRIGGSWAPVPALSITPFYQYVSNNPWTSNAQAENRLCLLTAYRIPVYTATLTLANTTEYRISDNLPNSWWLRPKITIANPVGPGKWGLNAFAADEILYNNQREVFTQDRVTAGFEKKFNDDLTMQLYYCRLIQMNNVNPDANVICVDFRITFGEKKAAPYQPDLE